MAAAAAHHPDHRALQRLVRRICSGEVVFFIGAGFSLDAEGNSASVLVLRLLLRFEAMCKALRRCRPGSAARVRALQLSLRSTFELGASGRRALNDLYDERLDARVKSLVNQYYQFNDWLCTAFDEWLGLAAAPLPAAPAAPAAASLPAALDAACRAWEAKLGQRALKRLKWTGPLVPTRLDLPLWAEFHAYCRTAPSTQRALAGKLVFLDSMGFADHTVMAGAPMAQDLQRTIAAAQGRQSARHQALAWLAAEGLCPVLITTNFDLLLDSALRLAGMAPANPSPRHWVAGEPALHDGQRVLLPPSRRYSHFACITEARQFFSHAQTLRAAHLYKLHGCVERFRIARNEAAGVARLPVLRAVLPTIVFTFREIQNWRDDTWSRDHLNTVLRTKTMAFAGYSTADPVIHDTFRTIYEEMAGYRVAQPGGLPAEHTLRGGALSGGASGAVPADDEDDNERAPAFFIGTRNTFHGLEVLRAASMACGATQPPLTQHPNLLAVHFKADAGFPTVDETFTLLYHQSLRRLQREALASQAMHVHYLLTGRRCPDCDAAAVVRHFDTLCQADERAIDRLFCAGRATPPERLALARRTAWTWHFQRSLMREYALAEQGLRPGQDVLAAQRAGVLPWYCPASEHPDWAAWGAILELALRHAHADVSGGREDGLWPVEHAGPLLAVRTGGALLGLGIELAGMRRVYLREWPRVLRAGRPQRRWLLRGETVPWWRDDGHLVRPEGTPSATELWQRACTLPGMPGMQAGAAQDLGLAPLMNTRRWEAVAA